MTHQNLLFTNNNNIELNETVSQKWLTLKHKRLLLFILILTSLILLVNYTFLFKNAVASIYNEINIRQDFYKNPAKIKATNSSSSNKCPLIPPNLGTRIEIKTNAIGEEAIAKLDKIASLNISLGGQWSPSNCESLYRVAIVIPYRDRKENLELFLMHMHPFLSKQQLEYGVYLVEPEKNLTFNRGLLMNIGFAEAMRESKKWQCFVFHDVDLLPEDERNIYSCPETPRHMSAAVSTLKYKLPYNTIFGGVTEFKKEHFEKINGFSNLYFGWGGEDDDLRERVVKSGMSVSRYPLDIGRYYMAKHEKDKPNPERFNLLKTTSSRFKNEGLNSLDYDVISIEKRKLYTKIIVSYDKHLILNRTTNLR